MDIFQELGVRRCINAHDTYTIYGGSRMAPLTLRAMKVPILPTERQEEYCLQPVCA